MNNELNKAVDAIKLRIEGHKADVQIYEVLIRQDVEQMNFDDAGQKIELIKSIRRRISECQAILEYVFGYVTK